MMNEVLADGRYPGCHTGVGDPQDVGNAARGQEVRSGRYPVNEHWAPAPVSWHGAGFAAVTPPNAARRHQQGVVLLALILVVLVGSSAVLLGKLNERAQDIARQVQTQAALRDARNALIRFAVTYPETQDKPDRSPGYLPCPDQDDDGSAESNCADTTGSTLGLLPARDLGIDALLDSSGGRIWYAVSDEFKNNQPATHVLNSDTRATLSVDGADDVVAVLIAAGTPVNGQAGRGTAATEVAANSKDWYEVADEFLEDGNPTSTDEAYVTGSTVAGSAPECTDGSLDEDQIESQCYNDQLITITRQELMAAVEARVANDVRAALAGYRNEAGGAFPWLVPFSDPKRGGRHGASIGGYGLSGQHTSATTNNVVLTDSNADFALSGVANGDLIWNVTDGSYATISAVTATTVTVGALTGGVNNAFAEDDVYYIEAAAPALAGLFDGTAGVASGGTSLDAGVDLEQFGIVPGDVIDDVTDPDNIISGVVTAVAGNDAELDPASGVAFDPGDPWRIRGAIGLASAGSTAATLVDADVNFVTEGVQAGDWVRNITDGSQGEVLTVGAPDNQTLTVTSLFGGTNNVFAAGDNYALVRQRPTTSTRFGLLPVHEYGKPFETEFSAQWTLLSASGNTITVSAPGAATTYTTAITNWVQRSTLYSDSTGVDASYPDAVTADSDIACIWAGLNIAHCGGKFVDLAFLTAAAESVSQSGAIYSITDTGTRFNYSGIRAGAKIRNLDQPGVDEGIVYAASSLTQNLVRAVAVNGGTPFTVADGDRVQVLVASKRTPATGGYSADGATVANQACSAGANFWSFVGAGDTIRLNSATYGNPIGLITGAPSADCVTYTDLQGGTASSIALGQSFRILYDFVEERHWEFKVRMAGTPTLGNVAAGVRQRSVCQGFDSDCTTMSAASLYLADNTNPVIGFTDYDSSANVLGSASVTVPAAGAAQGSLLVEGLDLLFAEDAEDATDDGFLPRWFIRNRWHEYVFVSYADGFSPDNFDDCTAGTDCLTVTAPSVTVQDNRHAVAIVAGAELAGQDRATVPVALADYFEDENADPDTGHLFFERADTDDTFNDQLSAVIPD